MQKFGILRLTFIVGVVAFCTLAQGIRAEDEARQTQEGKKMSRSEISWVFAVKVKQGAEEKLKAMIVEMSEQAEATEPGTIGYQWSISHDGSSGQVHEQYRDSEAALSHLASFNENFAARLMNLVEPTGMVVFGPASTALKKELEGANPVYMMPAGGFVR